MSMNLEFNVNPKRLYPNSDVASGRSKQHGTIAKENIRLTREGNTNRCRSNIKKIDVPDIASTLR